MTRAKQFFRGTLEVAIGLGAAYAGFQIARKTGLYPASFLGCAAGTPLLIYGVSKITNYVPKFMRD